VIDLTKEIAEARVELSQKSEIQIEKETAKKWMARAIVAYELGQVIVGALYAHEAIEHGAHGGPVFLSDLQAELLRFRARHFSVGLDEL
jgi:hypothetical protein